MTVDSAGSRLPASSADRPSELRRAPAAVAAAVVAAGSAAMIVGAYVFQHVLNIPPCPLCLEQRIPHYIAAPLALIVLAMAAKDAPRMLVAAGLAALALALLTTAGIGLYHSGVEWKWWPGPADCTGAVASFGTAGGNLLKQMQTAVVVRCDDVQWRFAGLSLAGYNALFSFALAVIAGWGLVRTIKRPQ
jgi:disulfide bond formation protein DsbB